MWSDAVSAVLGGSGLVGIIGAVVLFVRTRQQGKLVEANVIKSLGTTVGDFAEDVRRDAQITIDAIRRDAQAQIEYATRRADRAEERAERAEARAVTAERSAIESATSAMQANASMRRLTLAITSPYASLEGLRAMVAPDGPMVNGKG